MRMPPTGALKWRYETTGDEGEAFFLAMAVDGEGSIVAGGYQPVTLDDQPGQPQRIVHKLDPGSGMLLWSTIVDVEDNPIGSVQDLTIRTRQRDLRRRHGGSSWHLHRSGRVRAQSLAGVAKR